MTVIAKSSIPSLYLKEVCSKEIDNISNLSSRTRNNYSTLFREFSHFFQLDLHDKYLCGKKSDWITDENTCSICKKVTDTVAERYVFLNFPLIFRDFDAEIAVCDSSQCIEEINSYAVVVKNHFGPFVPQFLRKYKTYVDVLGIEQIRSDNVRMNGQKWHFENIHLKYNASQQKMEVIVELAKRNVGCMGKISATLDQLIAENRKINFHAVIDTLPETPGGDFIRRYALSLIGTPLQNSFSYVPRIQEDDIEKICLLSTLLGKFKSQNLRKPFENKPFEECSLFFIQKCIDRILKELITADCETNELVEIFKNLFKNYNAIIVKCRSLDEIEHQFIGIIEILMKHVSSKVHIKILDFNFENTFGANKLRSEFNCFDYAFYCLSEIHAMPFILGVSQESYLLKDPESSSYGFVLEILKAWGYSEALQSQPGDLIIYFDECHKAVHFGIMDQKENIVISKWGDLPVFEHAIEVTPSDYGSYYLFFRKRKRIGKRKRW